jgi:hypothetical protein
VVCEEQKILGWILLGSRNSRRTRCCLLGILYHIVSWNFSDISKEHFISIISIDGYILHVNLWFLSLCLPCSSYLKMEVVRFSRTSVSYQAAWYHIPEYLTVHTPRHNNSKCNTFTYICHHGLILTFIHEYFNFD